MLEARVGANVYEVLACDFLLAMAVCGGRLRMLRRAREAAEQQARDAAAGGGGPRERDGWEDLGGGRKAFKIRSMDGLLSFLGRSPGVTGPGRGGNPE